jgi:hypothetical protein
MASFTLHNESGDFMHVTARSLDSAKKKCDEMDYKCKVMETYYAKSPWRPWDNKLVAHGKEVHRNY